MSGTPADAAFQEWLQCLRKAAADRDAEWLVPQDTASLHAAFTSGRSAAAEIDALMLLAEWRGCGCGGT
jgi:uncharacterized iron-regulated membrane protein